MAASIYNIRNSFTFALSLTSIISICIVRIKFITVQAVTYNLSREIEGLAR